MRLKQKNRRHRYETFCLELFTSEILGDVP